MELDALRLHLADAPVDQMLFHLELGYAVSEQAADFGVLFIEMHLVSGARELLRASHSGGTRADHGDLLVRRLTEHLRLDPTVGERTIDDRALDRLDRHRRFVEV